MFIRPLRFLPTCVDPDSLISEEIHGSSTSPGPHHRARGIRLPPAPSLQDLVEHGAPEGQRHNTLVRYLGSLFSYGVPEEEALKTVLEHSRLNHPPLSVGEVMYTVKDCYRRFMEREDECVKE